MKYKYMLNLLTWALLIALLCGCSTVSKTTEAPAPSTTPSISLESSSALLSTPTPTPTQSSSSPTEEPEFGVVERDGKSYLKTGRDWNSVVPPPVGYWKGTYLTFSSADELYSWCENYDLKNVIDIENTDDDNYIQRYYDQYYMSDLYMLEHKITDFLLPEEDVFMAPSVNNPINEDFKWLPQKENGYVKYGFSSPSLVDTVCYGYSSEEATDTMLAYLSGTTTYTTHKNLTLENYGKVSTYENATEIELFGNPTVRVETTIGTKYFQSYTIEEQTYYLYVTESKDALTGFPQVNFIWCAAYGSTYHRFSNFHAFQTLEELEPLNLGQLTLKPLTMDNDA